LIGYVIMQEVLQGVPGRYWLLPRVMVRQTMTLWSAQCFLVHPCAFQQKCSNKRTFAFMFFHRKTRFERL
jgi:hypothetical protein